MENKEYYSIGEVSNICGLSKKALRYYDRIGLICPDRIGDDNNYRFYTKKTLLNVPIIKYYKQMGFRLEEMRELLDGNTFRVLEHHFRGKIQELKEAERDIYIRYTSVSDWYNLILEAASVIENHMCGVSAKFLDTSTVLYYEQDFNYNYMESIVNIDFTNYIEQQKNAITGPVMINFPSFRERRDGTCKKIRVMQKAILEMEPGTNVATLGGCVTASCYHIGSHDTINDTYNKISDWADKNGYQCEDQSIERYVTDYWTTRNTDYFVTEILVKITKI